MAIAKVVVNASPLITLFKSNQAELLPQLFQEIVIPQGVWDEIVIPGQLDDAAQMLPKTKWINYRKLERVHRKIEAWDLGVGESQVLSYALTHLDYTAMVDDMAARKCAKTFNIPTLGTGAMIVLAKRKGLISSVTPRLKALQDSGLWLSEEVISLLKARAGE
ncbi:DUF3368 domain-containing protein [Euhalothece natronophila Z-M001]|uniref:DUF3368 domain-containing protein n=1 Tax=Euhalothece natronophila Z-M001 TaxID=522448 RepID=A0A5B8NP70_9CHRO|nr:DUF3368 domain-containing protein [Euhalothece natronophila]QDZ40757.1 DUF3368 domain-containing protein [Euhalothece natronophila Z-M001]